MLFSSSLSVCAKSSPRTCSCYDRVVSLSAVDATSPQKFISSSSQPYLTLMKGILWGNSKHSLLLYACPVSWLHVRVQCTQRIVEDVSRVPESILVLESCGWRQI